MAVIEFKPKYQRRLLLSFAIMIPAGAFIVITMLLNGIDNLPAFIGGLAFSLCIFFIPLIIYRKIVFKNEYIRVDRYLLQKSFYIPTFKTSA